MRYFDPEREKVNCPVELLNCLSDCDRGVGAPAQSRTQEEKKKLTYSVIGSRRAFSTLSVVCLAMLTWSMASMGVQLTTPLGSLLAIALLGAMGNHVYQWTASHFRQVDNHLQSNQIPLPPQVRSAA